MKTFLRFALVALMCCVAYGFLEYGRYEKESAAAEEALYSFDLKKADALYAGLEHHFRYLEHVPGMLGNSYSTIVYKRAEIAYLRGDYVSLAGKEGELIASEKDPRMLFVRANAFYRIVEGGFHNEETIAKRIDKLVQEYEGILRQDPANMDAAYNYEYLQRHKSELMKKKPDAEQEEENKDQNGNQGQQRAEEQLFGREGQKTKDGAQGTDKFKTYVPEGDDNRPRGDDAGKGKPKKKKG